MQSTFRAAAVAVHRCSDVCACTFSHNSTQHTWNVSLLLNSFSVVLTFMLVGFAVQMDWIMFVANWFFCPSPTPKLVVRSVSFRQRYFLCMRSKCMLDYLSLLSLTVGYLSSNRSAENERGVWSSLLTSKVLEIQSFSPSPTPMLVVRSPYLLSWVIVTIHKE